MSKGYPQAIQLSIGIVSLGILGLTGCDLDSQTDATGVGTAGANHPPVIRSVTLAPIPIVREGVVTATVDAEDLDRDAMTFTFKWIVNDELRPKEVSSPSFHPERLNLGDRVVVEAIPHDGKVSGSPVRSGSVVVGNTPPAIRTLTIQPSGAKVGDRLVATVEGGDIDGDDVRYTYRWSHNNQVAVEGEQGTLDTTGFSRGDVIAVSVTPHDRGSHGKEQLSELLTLANSPPKFISSAQGGWAQGQFSYAASAADPENDPLIYALESAPSGMTIEEKTGRIQWEAPADSAGVYKVKILVKDDYQGWASQELNVTFGNSVAAKRSGP